MNYLPAYDLTEKMLGLCTEIAGLVRELSLRSGAMARQIARYIFAFTNRTLSFVNWELLMMIKDYSGIGIQCQITSEGCKITGADGQYKILEDWLNVYQKTFWESGRDTTEGILKDLACVIDAPQQAKRVYRYKGGWNICPLEFSRSSPYAIITVKYPLASHVWLGRWRAKRVPIVIFYELLTLAEATKP